MKTPSSPKDRTLSSPNRMVWELFEALRRLCARASDVDNKNESAQRQDAAICVILSVQCVEVFFNIYFRVLISEAAFSHAAEQISSDLEKTQFGLDRKIKEWPHLVFGKQLSLDKGAGQRFVTLKSLRHKLMHFSSSHESFEIPGVTVHGLADTSVYEQISASTATDALHIAEAFLCEVFTLRGVTASDLPHSLLSWTGRPPMKWIPS